MPGMIDSLAEERRIKKQALLEEYQAIVEEERRASSSERPAHLHTAATASVPPFSSSAAPSIHYGDSRNASRSSVVPPPATSSTTGWGYLNPVASSSRPANDYSHSSGNHSRGPNISPVPVPTHRQPITPISPALAPIIPPNRPKSAPSAQQLHEYLVEHMKQPRGLNTGWRLQGVPFDVYDLFRSVIEAGGSTEASSKDLWPSIGATLGMPSVEPQWGRRTSAEVGHQLRRLHLNMLGGLEKMWDNAIVVEQAASDWKSPVALTAQTYPPPPPPPQIARHGSAASQSTWAAAPLPTPITSTSYHQPSSSEPAHLSQPGSRSTPTLSPMHHPTPLHLTREDIPGGLASFVENHAGPSRPVPLATPAEKHPRSSPFTQHSATPVSGLQFEAPFVCSFEDLVTLNIIPLPAPGPRLRVDTNGTAVQQYAWRCHELRAATSKAEGHRQPTHDERVFWSKLLATLRRNPSIRIPGVDNQPAIPSASPAIVTGTTHEQIPLSRDENPSGSGSQKRGRPSLSATENGDRPSPKPRKKLDENGNPLPKNPVGRPRKRKNPVGRPRKSAEAQTDGETPAKRVSNPKQVPAPEIQTATEPIQTATGPIQAATQTIQTATTAPIIVTEKRSNGPQTLNEALTSPISHANGNPSNSLSNGGLSHRKGLVVAATNATRLTPVTADVSMSNTCAADFLRRVQARQTAGDTVASIQSQAPPAATGPPSTGTVTQNGSPSTLTAGNDSASAKSRAEITSLAAKARWDKVRQNQATDGSSQSFSSLNPLIPSASQSSIPSQNTPGPSRSASQPPQSAMKPPTSKSTPRPTTPFSNARVQRAASVIPNSQSPRKIISLSSGNRLSAAHIKTKDANTPTKVLIKRERLSIGQGSALQTSVVETPPAPQEDVQTLAWVMSQSEGQEAAAAVSEDVHAAELDSVPQAIEINLPENINLQDVQVVDTSIPLPHDVTPRRRSPSVVFLHTPKQRMIPVIELPSSKRKPSSARALVQALPPPVNRARIVIPIGRARRAKLIQRGHYDAFRDDDSEDEAVARKAYLSLRPMKALPRNSIARSARPSQPEQVPLRFLIRPGPAVTEPLRSILEESSLLKRCTEHVCGWKGCDAVLASEDYLQRHVVVRGHAAQGVFQAGAWGMQTLYRCHWRGCEEPCFESVKDLNQHMIARHISRNLLCPYPECDLTSPTISHLSRHVMKQHDEEADHPRSLADLTTHLPPPFPIPTDQPLPEIARTDELTTPVVQGSIARAVYRQEWVRNKVQMGCFAGDDPIIHVEHPPHMLEKMDEETASVPGSGSDGEGVAVKKQERLLDQVLRRPRRELVVEVPTRKRSLLGL